MAVITADGTKVLCILLYVKGIKELKKLFQDVEDLLSDSNLEELKNVIENYVVY